MNQIRELGRVVGSVLAVVDLAWTAFEAFRLWSGENVLIQDAFEFFREHPEHLPGALLALVVAGITLLIVLYARWVSRQLRMLWPGNRLLDMVPKLEEEFEDTQNEIDFARTQINSNRVVERQTIRLALHELGIDAPGQRDPHNIHLNFLTAILPHARTGDVQAARKVAKGFKEIHEKSGS